MEPAPRVPAVAGVRITVDDRGWRRLVRRLDWVASRAAEVTGSDVSIVLSDDRTVRRLNARHRGQDKATNVLTFEAPGHGLPGEIVLARGTIQREAAAAGRSASDHMVHLIVHGALHLAGHDHLRAGEARRMELAETRLLARLGVGNPWRARPATGP